MEYVTRVLEKDRETQDKKYLFCELGSTLLTYYSITNVPIHPIYLRILNSCKTIIKCLRTQFTERLQFCVIQALFANDDRAFESRTS